MLKIAQVQVKYKFKTETIKNIIFIHNLCKASLSANILLNKLFNPYLKDRCLLVLRKGCVHDIYENIIQQIRDFVQNKCRYLGRNLWDYR